MDYKVLLWTDVFWISYIKCYKFKNNNLSVLLVSKQGGRWNSWTPNTRTERQFNCWLCLNFLVYFAGMSSYFSMKTNKRKVRKCFKCVKEFSRRFELANGKYFSIFLEFLQELSRLHIFLRLSIFTKGPT